MTTSPLPTIRPFPGSDPVASPDATVTGDHWRVTVLRDGLFRIEWSEDGGFEDRASTFAIRRRLDVPEYTVTRRGEGGRGDDRPRHPALRRSALLLGRPGRRDLRTRRQPVAVRTGGP
ncbi:hypothetical protein [Curtobacterium sp. MCPF17_052]|uniref:hypothetical protein n=1 Tax=Curtobacterium sp. MCPF17_052 TaxID=2175655 RepID=UPI0024DFE389|nr:hypothetical protein [Curtobacterium sp. MCPF17_052]WIB13393.1 hypothetical protein DEJ36_06140 [Curtobacterium sp. MCPF17_052]